MNAPTPEVSPGRMIWILTRMAVRRKLNRIRHVLVKKQRKPGDARGPTPSKQRGGRLFVFFMSFFYLAYGLNISSRFLGNLGNALRMSQYQREGRVILRPDQYDTLKELSRGWLTAWQIDAMRAAAQMQSAEREQRAQVIPEPIQEIEMSTNRTDAAMIGVERDKVLEEIRTYLAVHYGQDDPRVETYVSHFKMFGMDGFAARPMKRLWADTEAIWPENVLRPAMVAGVAWGLCGMFLAVTVVLMGSGNQDLGRVEWYMEWLYTFPAPAGLLFLAQMVEKALTNWIGWFMLLPFLVTFYWYAGVQPWLVLPLAAIMTLCLHLMMAVVWVCAETWLRKRLDRARLKNIQAVFSLTGMALFFGVFGMALTPKPPEILVRVIERFSWVPLCLPSGLPAMAAMRGWALPVTLFGTLALTVQLVRAGMWAAQRMVRDGLLKEGGVYQGRSGRTRAAASGAWASGRRPWCTGMVGKELRLLARDRSLMVQTLIVPLFFIGLQAAVNPRLFVLAGANLHYAAVMAFGVAAYMLVTSALHVLSVEGEALWLLYTFPCGITQLMFRKACLWAVIAGFYAAAVLLWALYGAQRLPAGFALDVAMVFAGTPVFAIMTAGMGLMATDPLETEMRRRVKPSMVYVCMLPATMYGMAIVAMTPSQKLSALIFCALTAYAVWQKVRELAPYLLDPVVKPPVRLSLADGLITALGFFMLQVAFFLMIKHDDRSMGWEIAVSFSLAGLLTTVVSLLVFRFRGLPRLASAVGFWPSPEVRLAAGPRLWHSPWIQGVLWAIPAALFGALYLVSLKQSDAIRFFLEQHAIMLDSEAGLHWFILLSVISAPLFEEYIFRGLVYKGFCQSLRPVLAVLVSALIFAMIHPPLAILPVFVMSVCAALSYRYSGLLYAPIIVHTLYNATVLKFQ